MTPKALARFPPAPGALPSPWQATKIRRPQPQKSTCDHQHGKFRATAIRINEASMTPVSPISTCRRFRPPSNGGDQQLVTTQTSLNQRRSRSARAIRSSVARRSWRYWTSISDGFNSARSACFRCVFAPKRFTLAAVQQSAFSSHPILLSLGVLAGKALRLPARQRVLLRSSSASPYFRCSVKKDVSLSNGISCTRS